MPAAQQVAHVENETSSGGTDRPVRRRFLRYFLCALILPALTWLSAFPLVCAKSYEQWSETQWGPMLEYPFESSTPSADIVIFGDSSAFLGIDPRLINAQLGTRSLVLPSTVGSLPVMGDGPLRFYLAHHQQPKLIVLFFSPWNLDMTHLSTVRVFEGEEMLLRHGSWSEIARYAFRHPLEFFEFPLRVYSSFGQKMITSMLLHRNRARDTSAALGHAPYTDLLGPLTDLCRFPSDYLDRTSQQTAEELKRRYTSPSTRVMVYLAPIPRCVNSGVLQGRSYAAIGAAPPAALPPTYFAADPYYAHILPERVPDATQVFINALRQEMQSVPASPGR